MPFSNSPFWEGRKHWFLNRSVTQSLLINFHVRYPGFFTSAGEYERYVISWYRTKCIRQCQKKFGGDVRVAPLLPDYSNLEYVIVPLTVDVKRNYYGMNSGLVSQTLNLRRKQTSTSLLQKAH